MKKTLIATCVASVMMTGNVMADTRNKSQMTDDERLSYSLGMMIGDRILKQYSEDIDYYILLEGMRDQHQGKPTTLTMEEAHAAMQASEDRAIDKASETAIKAGKAYMEKNKAREGVKVTKSGLQYEVLTASDGNKPKATDIVKVHYKGTLLDGTVFDSTYERGQPVEFGLNQVIPGWTEGVQLMNVGSKYRFVIPSELAYGMQGAGSTIGPNETLIFEVELLNIVKP
ncbi:MAG: peptidylprolyl isomerase [Proteobacteria bacterium]|nr:MAG: peptidylprolyl isomerase [Pseudomonadota bacterium]